MRFHLLTRDIERANLVREMRLRTLFLFARAVKDVDGAVAELGVYKGRSAQLLARALPTKEIHLFDTWTGMPAMQDFRIDDHRVGDFADCSLADTQLRLYENQNVIFHQGVFPKTAEDLGHRRFSLAHFDGDLYASCTAFIEFFYPRMSKGGVMVFDDYDWPQCQGVRKAIEEAGLEAEEAVDYQAFVVNG